MIEVREQSEWAAAPALLLQHGALVYDGIFDLALLARVSARLQAYVDTEVIRLPGQLYRVGDRRLMCTVPSRAPFFDDALLDPPALRALFEVTLGPDYLIQSYGAVLSLPGSAPQHIHRDYSFLFNPQMGASLPAYALTVAIPLVPLDEHNGTTAMCLETHRGGDGEVYLPFPQLGGCYIWDYRLHHFGMPNRSKVTRPLLYLVYAAPWFIDPENFKTVAPLRAPEPGQTPSPRVAHLLRRAFHPRVECVA